MKPFDRRIAAETKRSRIILKRIDIGRWKVGTYNNNMRMRSRLKSHQTAQTVIKLRFPV